MSIVCHRLGPSPRPERYRRFLAEVRRGVARQHLSPQGLPLRPELQARARSERARQLASDVYDRACEGTSKRAAKLGGSWSIIMALTYLPAKMSRLMGFRRRGIKTGSTAAGNDLTHTWGNAGRQPLFQPASHWPRPPHWPSRRPNRFRLRFGLREPWEALAYAGARSL